MSAQAQSRPRKQARAVADDDSGAVLLQPLRLVSKTGSGSRPTKQARPVADADSGAVLPQPLRLVSKKGPGVFDALSPTPLKFAKEHYGSVSVFLFPLTFSIPRLVIIFCCCVRPEKQIRSPAVDMLREGIYAGSRGSAAASRLHNEFSTKVKGRRIVSSDLGEVSKASRF